MKKNGYIIGVIESSKMVFLKYQKPTFVNKASNLE